MNVRKAVLEDAEGMAKVHVDSWRTTYKDIVPDEFLNQLSYESRMNLWKNAIPNGHVFVAENEEGQIVGFSSGGKERTGNYEKYQGELYAIYLLKEYQGKGLGKMLVRSVIEDLEKLNINTMLVMVLEDNNSRLFYENLGGKKIDDIEIEIGGKKLNELVYGWDDIQNILPI